LYGQNRAAQLAEICRAMQTHDRIVLEAAFRAYPLTKLIKPAVLRVISSRYPAEFSLHFELEDVRDASGFTGSWCRPMLMSSRCHAVAKARRPIG
jgi:hypothetical protein